MSMKVAGSAYSVTRSRRNAITWRGAMPALLALALVFLCGADLVAQGRGRGKAARQKRASKMPGGEVLPRATFPKFPDWVACVAFSPDSRVLAAGSYEIVKLLDLVENKEIAKLAEPAGLVKSAVFARGGKQLVTGSYQSLAIWDVASAKRERTIKGPGGYVNSLALSPGGELLAGASDDETEIGRAHV